MIFVPDVETGQDYHQRTMLILVNFELNDNVDDPNPFCSYLFQANLHHEHLYSISCCGILMKHHFNRKATAQCSTKVPYLVQAYYVSQQGCFDEGFIVL